MRILFLSFYFEPDLGPGAVRNSQIVDVLLNRKEVRHVDVVTTQPHRYGKNEQFFPFHTQLNDKISIYRVDTQLFEDGVFGSSISFARYMQNVFGITRGKSYDLVYATTSRLMTGALGALVANRLKKPLYLDIRDLFIETISENYVTFFLQAILPFFKKIECFTLKNATKINVVSAGFTSYITNIVPNADCSNHTHGVDKKFILNESEVASQLPSYEILYAGNIGYGQSLDSIIPGVAKKLPVPWKIRIVGGGRRLSSLADSVANFSNIIIEKSIPRDQLIEHYKNATVLILHLGDKKCFHRSLPSKIFEYAATGKPVLVGCDGYMKQFVENNNLDNVKVFQPSNVDDFLEKLNQLTLNYTDRRTFCRIFDRELINTTMVSDIITTCEITK